MIALTKDYVHELMINKYPLLSFDPPTPCTFNLNAADFNNDLSQLIQSITGTDKKAGLLGSFIFTFLKEPTADRACSINIGVEDFRNASFSLLAYEIEAVTETVAKELIPMRETVKFDYTFMEVVDLSGNWSPAVFQFVNVNFVGWKITLGNR